MQRISKNISQPAPVGGLNVKDPLAAMPPVDATVMLNMFSQPYGCEVRKGNVRHADSLGSSVETLVPHTGILSPASQNLFAFANGNMYDITEPSVGVHTPILTGLSNNRWNGVGLSNASGYNQTLYNGEDSGIWIHSNSTVTRITQAIDPLNPGVGEISGVDPADIIGGTVHQKRVWLIEKNSSKAWYLEPEAITGLATVFNFGSIFTLGGKLVALATWTIDAGDGMDDLLVAISDLGQIAIYAGTDPSGSDTWGLKGVFSTGTPLAIRGVQRVEGDLLILTKFGLLSLAQAMARSQISGSTSDAYLSTKIEYLLSDLANRYGFEFGWQVVYWPDNNMILVNVPHAAADALSEQLIQSTVTKGWSQFINWNATCWAIYNGKPVYGDYSGNVWRAWEGYADGSVDDGTEITLGNPILAEIQTSFNFMQSPSIVKHAKMIRPTFYGAGEIPYSIHVNPDYYFTKAGETGSVDPETFARWGTALWDEDLWKAVLPRTQHVWNSVSGIGSAFAVRMAFKASQAITWVSYDLLYEEGHGI